MALFTLKCDNDKKEGGILEKVQTNSIEYEKDFENWLENSPDFLLSEEEGTILWIGRQTKAAVGESGLLVDLMGLDNSGNLVLVELKRGKTPRDVLAQILEYSTWGASLSYECLNKIASQYYKNGDFKDLKGLFFETFFPDEEGDLEIQVNKKQRLFIIAEEVSPIMKQVAEHLRKNYKIDISCLVYQVLKSAEGNFFVSTERVVGFDNVDKETALSKWKETILAKDAIREVIKGVINNDDTLIFTPVQIYKKAKESYPNINPNTVRHEIMRNCVNHTSRKNYSSQRDHYFRVSKGKFRQYNPKIDGKWNRKGVKIL